MTASRESSEERVARYRTEFRSVPGWFTDLDFDLFVAVSAHQRRLGMKGGLLEIGVFQGRSAILLGLLASEGEHLEVCDLFGDLPVDDDYDASPEDYAGLSRRTFEQNYQRFHAVSPVVHQMPSSRLSAADLAGVRFVHVDGGHTYDIVRGDCDLLRESLPEGAVVVFDDFAQARHYPVAIAVAEELVHHGLVPILMSPWKLYASWKPAGLKADQVLAQLPASAEVVVHRFREHEFPYVRYQATEPRTDQFPRLREYLPPAAVRAAARVRRRVSVIRP